MEAFQNNYTKVINYSNNIEKYNQEDLYKSVVDLRSIHGEMLGGFYKNLDKDLNNHQNKLELSFFDSMIDTTRKVLQLAESKFNMNNSLPSQVVNTQQNGGTKYDINNFKDKPMLMLFHAKWCGHCVQFMPSWLKLKGGYADHSKINMVEISDKNASLIKEYNINGFPTIKLYDGKKFHDYNGGRDINNIREFVNHKLKMQAIKD